jgi:hypothetical protein
MPPKAFGSSTGPVVDLQSRIRGILRDYPPGPSLLSEFIQNAGAQLNFLLRVWGCHVGGSRICASRCRLSEKQIPRRRCQRALFFLLPRPPQPPHQQLAACEVRNRLPTQPQTPCNILSISSVARLQHPSLVIQNDAVFTDDDFEHIRTLDQSR